MSLWLIFYIIDITQYDRITHTYPILTDVTDNRQRMEECSELDALWPVADVGRDRKDEECHPRGVRLSAENKSALAVGA